MLKKIGLALVSVLLLLIAILGFNTLRKGSRQLDVPPIASLAVDETGAASRLGEAVRLRTVSSRDDAALNTDQFKQLHALLVARFPKTHAILKREVVNDLNLLYTWEGTKTSAPPILLMAHQDVVPIAPGTEKNWTVDPFSGVVQDGFVWGRGAWDDKGNLMAQFEAIEMLVSSGYKPERTVYFAYGADEEVAGLRGAARIAALLKSRNIHLDFVLDEGMLITEGIMPGITKPAALIGIAEKGFVSLEMKVSTSPGHSSMPPPAGTSAISMISAALKHIDDHQFPASISGVAGEMFATLAPEMSGFQRVALSNLWLFGPMVQKQLEKGASTSAMMRTTTALTIVKAGNKDNVLPGNAEATVNFRLLPGDTKELVAERVKTQILKATGNDRFELKALPGSVDASKVAPVDSAQYQLINRTVREVFPGTLVAPGLTIGGTDSIHYGDISDHIFKFSPVRAKAEDIPRFHGTNERISIRNLTELIRFYHQLLTQGAKAP